MDAVAALDTSGTETSAPTAADLEYAARNPASAGSTHAPPPVFTEADGSGTTEWGIDCRRSHRSDKPDSDDAAYDAAKAVVTDRAWSEDLAEETEIAATMAAELEQQARVAFEAKMKFQTLSAEAYRTKLKVQAFQEELRRRRELKDPELEKKRAAEAEAEAKRRLHDGSHEHDFVHKSQEHWQASERVKTDGNCLASCVCVLVRTSGPVNLGLIARTCANLGVTQLRLVAPICDVNCSDSRKFSNHACSLLMGAKVYDTLAEALGDCQYAVATSGLPRDTTAHDNYFTPEQIPAALNARVRRAGAESSAGRSGFDDNDDEKKTNGDVDADEVALNRAFANEAMAVMASQQNGGDAGVDGSGGECERLAVRIGRWAIVFGNESHGLSADELAECQATVNIPTRSYYTSYNLCQAVAITLYSISRGQRIDDLPVSSSECTATRSHMAALFKFLVFTLDRIKYRVMIQSRPAFMLKLRRFFNIKTPNRMQVNLVFSLLRAVHYHAFGDDGTKLIGDLPDEDALDPEVAAAERVAKAEKKAKKEAEAAARATKEAADANASVE